jgi:hypothetical protein
VEGVHHRDRGGDLLSGGGLEAGEPGPSRRPPPPCATPGGAG